MKKLLPILLICIIVVVLAAAVLFTYSFVTMDSEEDLLKELDQSKSYIQTQLEFIAKIEVQKEQISNKLDSMREGESSLQEKMQIMDLNVEIHKLNRKVHEAEVVIDMHQRKIKEVEKKIAELRGKSFLKRFLRL